MDMQRDRSAVLTVSFTRARVTLAAGLGSAGAAGAAGRGPVADPCNVEASARTERALLAGGSKLPDDPDRSDTPKTALVRAEVGCEPDGALDDAWEGDAPLSALGMVGRSTTAGTAARVAVLVEAMGTDGALGMDCEEDSTPRPVVLSVEIMGLCGGSVECEKVAGR
jgi:hypothetical protein